MARGKAIIHLWETATVVPGVGGSITSRAIGTKISMGYSSLLVTLAGASPSVDISVTVGFTETATFHTPYDTVGTSLGTIYSTLTVTRWIEFSPPLAPYIKITITGDASNGGNTTAKASFLFEEEFR